MSALVESKLNPDLAVVNETCKAGDPWSGIVKKGQILRILDLEGNQAVDTLFYNADNPEEKIVITSPMSSAQLKGCHEVQNLGAVQTYTRRYLWVAALEIVEHDAVDSSKGTEEDASGRLGEVVKALETQNGWALLNLAKVDEQGYRFAFGRLNTKQKALARELEQKAAVMRMEYVASLIECRENTDEAYANQLLEELPSEGKRMVWDMCPEDTKAFIRSLKEAK